MGVIWYASMDGSQYGSVSDTFPSMPNFPAFVNEQVLHNVIDKFIITDIPGRDCSPS